MTRKIRISEYAIWYKELKDKVPKAQVKSEQMVNTALLELYSKNPQSCHKL